MSTLHDPTLCRALLQKLRLLLLKHHERPFRFMEVCGTHTVSLFRSGLRSLLPSELVHVSGPGCPVCVTDDSEVAAFLTLAEQSNVIVATFGDVLRIPAPDGRSLKHVQAQGARIEIVYSPLDVLSLAAANPTSEVIFLGVGFETTAPTVAALLVQAKARQLNNLTVFSCHKRVPPALAALLKDTDHRIDGFLLPGHVAMVLGNEPFHFIAEEFLCPAVVSGFEPAEMLEALCMMVEQGHTGSVRVINAYPRAVCEKGNPRARAIMDSVFQTSHARWRGLGEIPDSGLALKADYADFDACKRFGIVPKTQQPLAGCRCGDVLKGQLTPPQCPLFGHRCRPEQPVGPCMVSTEGSCAAFFAYSVQ